MRPGLAATDTQNEIYAATSVASTVGGTIGTVVGGPVLGALVSGAISAAGALASTIAGVFSGCGQTCVETSNAANKVAQLLTQNVQNYISQPVRTISMQAACLAVFDQAWAQLEQVCGNPAYGSAGQRCITDRQRGACIWKTSPGGWQQSSDGTWTYVWAGANGSGDTCWNWFVGMRDPIANDPAVIPDSALASAGVSVNPATGQIVPSAAPSSSLSPLLIVGVLGLIIWGISR